MPVSPVNDEEPLLFWQHELGHRPLADITADEVDDALRCLSARGRLKAGRGIDTTRSGKPLAEATITRYVSTLGGVYKYARKMRLLKKGHLSPTRGVETSTSPIDKNKFMTEEEIDRVIKVARITDRFWGKLACLIVMGFHTGMRAGSLMSLRWQDVDFDTKTAYVQRTKNGEPHVATLTDRCIAELKRLPKGQPLEPVFAGRTGKPFHYRGLWNRTVKSAGLEGRTFHWLRHSCGAAMARRGESQAMIMAVMNHKTLAASARYMHASVEDRRAVVERVFQ